MLYLRRALCGNPSSSRLPVGWRELGPALRSLSGSLRDIVSDSPGPLNLAGANASSPVPSSITPADAVERGSAVTFDDALMLVVSCLSSSRANMTLRSLECPCSATPLAIGLNSAAASNAACEAADSAFAVAIVSACASMEPERSDSTC